MPNWDIFHSDRLETRKSLKADAIRQALARGEIGEDDLIRPTGETRWVRIGDSPDFAGLAGTPPAPSVPDPEPDSIEAIDAEATQADLGPLDLNRHNLGGLDREALADVERGSKKPEAEFEFVDDSGPILRDDQTHKPDLPELDEVADFDVIVEEEDDEVPEVEPEPDPQDEDEEAAEFTLSRNRAETVEELDLAAMVDVAFQLVLFFLVTAQVVLFKTLEIPKPNEDKPPEAAAQGRAKSVDELEKDYILVEVDAAGAIKVDRQPVPANRPTLVERLRKTREDTSRTAMLLSADFATRHENAVLVFDVANEIGLKIAIAQPAAKK